MKELNLLTVIKSKECMICHYWFFNHGLKFQDSVCNGCHDLTMISDNISNISVITIKNIDYRCIIHNTFFVILFCFSIYKMVDSVNVVCTSINL